MYSVEQFIELSPPEAHSEDALSDEHQLMLNRLGFELVERQRFNLSSAAIADSYSFYFHTSVRLDRKVKELAQEKEELLKTSKSQAATTENVKVQIETLLKVALPFLPVRNLLIHLLRPRQKSERRSRSLSLPLRTHHETRPCRVNIPILGVLPHAFRIFPTLSYHPLWGSITNCTRTLMNLMDTKYNFRRKERTELIICLGKDIRGAKFEPGGECREGDEWSGVIVSDQQGQLIRVEMIADV
jgi:hypothetical protein